MAQWQPGKRAGAESSGESSRRRDWAGGDGPQTTADPQRYTRFVTIMKRALLLAALALIVAVIAYSLQPREKGRVAMTFEHVGTVANDLAMIQRAGLGVAYHAKPMVAEAAGARIDHADLRGLLYLQGYRDDEIVSG